MVTTFLEHLEQSENYKRPGNGEEQQYKAGHDISCFNPFAAFHNCRITLRYTICCCTGFAILSGDYTVTAWRSIILFTWFKPCNNIGWFRYCRTWQKCKNTTENGISVVWNTQWRIFYIDKSQHFCKSVLLKTLGDWSSFYRVFTALPVT